MRILQIHNRHLVAGGSEVMFRETVSLLRSEGHEVTLYERHNGEVRGIAGKMRAASSGLYSLRARHDVEKLIKLTRPEIVHVHNLYPLISPSVLDACREARVPVVMRLPDFTLLCPTSHHFRKGAVCERCLDGREYHCILTNCRGNILMSTAYAMRNMLARLRRCFHQKVTFFIAPTNFVRQRFIAAGFEPARITVLPNLVKIPAEKVLPSGGDYVAYVGRISPEKGIHVLVEGARAAGLPVKIAGDASRAQGLSESLPENVELVGEIEHARIGEFFRRARFAVVPSLCFESFSLACAEAMAHGLPVIASGIGGLSEVVDHMKTGVLFRPAEHLELARYMRLLWAEPEMIDRFGEAARRKSVDRFSPEAHYRQLLSIYRLAIGHGARGL